MGATAETIAQPVKHDNDSYVRDYSRCILCYKCVEACGEPAPQGGFRSGGRGSPTRGSAAWTSLAALPLMVR